jgi:hypothetical protein
MPTRNPAMPTRNLVMPMGLAEDAYEKSGYAYGFSGDADR